jgi:hypothetical protein
VPGSGALAPRPWAPQGRGLAGRVGVGAPASALSQGLGRGSLGAFGLGGKLFFVLFFSVPYYSLINNTLTKHTVGPKLIEDYDQH